MIAYIKYLRDRRAIARRRRKDIAFYNKWNITDRGPNPPITLAHEARFLWPVAFYKALKEQNKWIAVAKARKSPPKASQPEVVRSPIILSFITFNHKGSTSEH